MGQTIFLSNLGWGTVEDIYEAPAIPDDPSTTSMDIFEAPKKGLDTNFVVPLILLFAVGIWVGSIIYAMAEE